jgi:hypothetical protein
METLVVFGVGLGNLGRFARKRVKAAAWIECLNAALAHDSPSVKVLTTFGHTGNFVVQSAASPHVVSQHLTNVLKTGCVVLKLARLKRILTAMSKLRQKSSSRFRYTPGAAMLVCGNPSGQIPKSRYRAKYRKLGRTVVLVLKRDALTAQGKIDRDRRFGGWGGISGEIRRYRNGQWTSRSCRTLSGTWRKALEAGSSTERVSVRTVRPKGKPLTS